MFHLIVQPSKILIKNIDLTWELAKRELFDRYSGDLLGGLWTVINPLLLLCLYTFVFGFIFPVRMNINVPQGSDYITYLMSGLVPWLAFSELISKGATLLQGNAGFVKQLSFPTEVLSFKTAISASLGQLISLAILLCMIVLKSGIGLSLLLLPMAMFFQALLMVGSLFLLSVAGIFFKDTKNIIAFVLTANFFLIPMIYLPGSSPWMLEMTFDFNPFSYLIWVYQDIFFFGSITHIERWVIFAFGSLSVYGVGYHVHSTSKARFGDYI